MYQKLLLFICIFFLTGLNVEARQEADTIGAGPALVAGKPDTVKRMTVFHRDTVAPPLFRALDSLQIAAYQDSIKKTLYFPGFSLQEALQQYRRWGSIPQYQEGIPVARGEGWIMFSLAALLIFFAFLKRVFDKQLTLIIQSFFSNRILGNINKEDNLFTAWPFLFLFIHFGFTIGLFLYLAARQQELSFNNSGFEVFVSLSAAVILLYAFKILALRLLGFFFNVQKPVSEYVSVLYLSYFNAALLFMPLVIAFALTPVSYGKFYVAIAWILLLIIFAFQFIRAGITVLSQNRFSKVYLLLYFCTLEICPILILIKAIGF